MTFINSVLFNETNTAAGLPLSGGLAHLSVPLGLVCVKHQLYDKKRNIEMSEIICESEFDKLAKGVQHSVGTRRNNKVVVKKLTKKQRKN